MAVPKSIIGKIISIMWTSLICEGSGMQPRKQLPANPSVTTCCRFFLGGSKCTYFTETHPLLSEAGQ